MKKILICLLLCLLCVGIFVACNSGDEDEIASGQQDTSDAVSEETSDGESDQTEGEGGTRPPASRPGAGNSSSTEDTADREESSEAEDSSETTEGDETHTPTGGNELPPIWLE